MTHTGPTARPGDYLMSQLQGAMSRAGSEVLNALAPEYTSLRWTIPLGTELSQWGMRGMTPGWMASREEVEFALQGWAEQLDLQLDESPAPGTVRYEGTLYGLPVTVWGVIDGNAYRAHVRKLLDDA